MAAGVTARRVAEDMDITPSSLSKWCKGEALPEKRKGPPSVRIESKMMAPHVRRARRVWRHGDDVRTAAAQAVLSGRTQQDVAHEFDVSSSVVSRWLTEFLKPKKKTEENMTRTAGESRYYPPKEKMKAVAALRARQKKEGGERRGQIAGVAREMGIPRELLGNWSSSGEYEPDEAPTTETLMSRPEPQPASQQLPPPVTTVQPVATTQIPAHYYAPPQPPPPPPSAPWWQGPAAVATAPASVASPQMMGLEEYIRKMVEHEVNRQVPIVVRATLEKMWGGQR
jgi:transposase-like protein